MCMNSGALFPSSINGRVNKRTFTLGLQNVNPHSEMSDVLSGVFRKTTCNWTTQLVRLHKALLDAQPMPNSMISSLLARLYKRILKSPPKPHNAWVSRKPFLNWNPMPTPLESHTGKNNVQLTDKNPMNLRAYLTVLTEGELCLGFQQSHNNSPVTDKTLAALFYWTH